MLGRRLGPDRALLAQRTDLHADYVRTVVRAGLNSMPALTRVEVTDVELDAIASYLSHPKPNHAASK
jgi:mono/diheme cytochrome c family protein